MTLSTCTPLYFLNMHVKEYNGAIKPEHVYLCLFIVFSFGDQTQGFTHTMQILCHETMVPAPKRNGKRKSIYSL